MFQSKWFSCNHLTYSSTIKLIVYALCSKALRLSDCELYVFFNINSTIFWSDVSENPTNKDNIEYSSTYYIYFTCRRMESMCNHQLKDKNSQLEGMCLLFFIWTVNLIKFLIFKILKWNSNNWCITWNVERKNKMN